MPRYENRMQLALGLLVGLLLLANLFTLTIVALTPATRAARAPFLYTVFLLTLVVSIPSILLLPRWLLRPYRQLVDEAERAPVDASARGRTRDESEFVLETFQEVVAQLRAKQRELERLSARASERAATAEQFSERVVASLPSGLVAFNSEGRATVVNAPALSILGLDSHAGGEDYSTLLARAPGLAEMVGRCLKTGELHRREEVSAQMSGGHARRLGVTVAPIDPQLRGGARGVLCMLTDITEVAELREALARKRNLESLGEMSAGLAHEFKNALATLHGYAQLLQNDALDRGVRAQSTTALLQEVRGLSEMVTSFLNFARPQPPDLGDVSLRELLDTCAADLRAFLEGRRVTLNIEGEFAEVRADERMLRQALANLMRNAAEAIPEDDSERRVAVRGSIESDEASAKWVKLEVEDTGTGIAAEDLQRIFIPFFTTKSKGHGVGLALAHRVATDHGGTLSASNTSNGGALFTLRLPA
ncbi:MAG: two-component system, NtrC family, sensor histidine kinase HydH [Acidobacteriota bacterium]|jgi:PAS domain S-box-containing protein|nr:two-component system, NtrC family, sensor histidine kinase HydH [Acidobacteriota bacterium]